MKKTSYLYLAACIAGSFQVQAQDKGREGLVEKSVEVQQNQAQLQQKIDAMKQFADYVIAPNKDV